MSEIIIDYYYYPIMQINGQRITGPPRGFENNAFSEIELFICNIPNDMFEPALLPLFSGFGTIYTFRLMMNFSGMNRGFAYLRYMHDSSAVAALAHLRRIEVQRNRFVYVQASRDIRRLIMTGIESVLQPDLVAAAISKRVPTEAVDIFSIGIEQCAIITFKTHREAALARRVLILELPMFGHYCRIKWFGNKK